MPTPPNYRIEGSGPVALACALFMARAGIDPARIRVPLPAAQWPRAVPRDMSSDVPRRMLALSDGTRQLLNRVIRLPEGGVIEHIHVSMAGRSGTTRIDAGDFGVAALGHVVPYPDLLEALREAAAGRGFAATAGQLRAPSPASLADDDMVIQAGGMSAQARQPGEAGIRRLDFGQSALLTEVMAESAGTTAYECFGPNGPLALLPAAAGHRPCYAVVWCDRPEHTQRRAALAPKELSVEIARAFASAGPEHSPLGELRVCAPVAVAPLSRTSRREIGGSNVVWIGNASQSLHPVAGQGLNLGLRDAIELARDLAENEYAPRPLPLAHVISRFGARRRVDRSVTTGITDLLAASFTWPLARPLQSTVLNALDLLPPLRRPLARSLLFGHR